MSEVRRGAVMLLTAGDAEISGAIADGILTARALMPIQVETEEAAIIRRKTAEALRRIDMRKRRSEDDEDIETRLERVRVMYAMPVRRPSALRRAGGALLGVYALAVLKIREFFDFNNVRWQG